MAVAEMTKSEEAKKKVEKSEGGRTVGAGTVTEIIE